MGFWLESGKICKNNGQTCLFHFINTCQVPREMFEHSALDGLMCKQHPRDPENVIARKNMYDSYIVTWKRDCFIILHPQVIPIFREKMSIAQV